MEGFYHYNIRKNKDAKGRISLGQVLSSDIIFILDVVLFFEGGFIFEVVIIFGGHPQFWDCILKLKTFIV